ncbi:MAG: alpha-L-fucosidase [Chitinivibrionales bacterium]|nr:alpha-L-fucosidase [Chitinivibrionales bacterium]
MKPAMNNDKMEWWRNAKLGLFIHWGPYAALKGDTRGTGIDFPAEWSRHALRIPREEYHALAREWNPYRFNADSWIALLREAGLNYWVLTTKHHDGFCMFDSDLTDFKISNSRFKRDVAGELAAASVRQGVRFGYYYSPRDWDHPDYLPHYEYYGKPGPHYGGWWGNKPEDLSLERNAAVNLHGGANRSAENADFFDCGCAGCKANLPFIDGRDPKKADLARYFAYEQGQVFELMTKYPDLSILWFDGRDHAAELAGTADFLARIRAKRPDIIVNDRIGAEGFLADFGVKESHIPETGEARDWEACMSMPLTSWGYDPNAHTLFTPAAIVKQAIEVVSMGGNFLINVSPDELGCIPVSQSERLLALGGWLRRFGDAIYGTRKAAIAPQQGIRFTAKGTALYAIQVDNPGADLWLAGLRMDAGGTAEFADGSGPLRWENHPAKGLHVRVSETSTALWAGEPALAFKLSGVKTIG